MLGGIGSASAIIKLTHPEVLLPDCNDFDITGYNFFLIARKK
jgi:hypothetical protein